MPAVSARIHGRHKVHVTGKRFAEDKRYAPPLAPPARPYSLHDPSRDRRREMNSRRVQSWRYAVRKTTDAENKRNTPIEKKFNRPRADDDDDTDGLTFREFLRVVAEITMMNSWPSRDGRVEVKPQI